MNILIVDDEPIIQIGLQQLVPWEEHGFQLLTGASNGVEALDRMSREHVDIVITDIRMPRMDGLELIRSLRQRDDDVAVLVLSCLDDFAYVKEAMKLGAKDYILKPTMEPEQLLRVIGETQSQLKEERRRRETIRRWENDLEQSRQMQLQSRFRHYIENGFADDQLEAELFADHSGMFTVLLHWSGSHQLLLEEALAEAVVAIAGYMPQSLLILCSNDYGNSDHDFFQSSYHTVRHLEQLLSRAKHPAGSDWYFCIGEAVKSLEDIRSNLELHRKQLLTVFYEDKRERVVGRMALLNEHSAAIPNALKNDFLRAVANYNEDAATYQAELIVAELKKLRPDLGKLHSFVFELLGLAAGYIRESGYSDIEAFEERFLSMEKIASCFHFNELSRFLLEAVQAIWSGRGADSIKQSSNHPFVKKAVKYIQMHYHENIGTTDIADYVKLSRSYLSDLYSRETGESLTETLTRVRIEEAKRLILQGEKKIYEIAGEVGFGDAKSFAKSFKRITGLTPKAYEQQNA